LTGFSGFGLGVPVFSGFWAAIFSGGWVLGAGLASETDTAGCCGVSDKFRGTGRVGAVGCMGETGVAKGFGGEAELTSEEATWLLVATDASGALEVGFLNILGLRISKICCL
jgi:hypothetical protein